MTRDTALSVALGLLALLALGVGAATLTSPVVVAGDGFGFGDWGFVTTEEDADARGGIPFDFPTNDAGGFAGPCLTWLRTTWGMLAVALLVAVPAAYVSYRTRWLLPGVAVVAAFGGPVFLLWTVLGSCSSGEFLSFDLPTSSGTGGGGGGGSLDGVVTVVARQPSMLFGLVLVVAILAAVALLVVSTGSVENDGEAEDPDAEPEAEPDVVAVGGAAGRAADRLSAPDADMENEVYRAWASMTDHLAVDHPESSTPAEFAEAAVDAGMGADDVAELTTLFEAVRYGGESATGSYEKQAVAALRRIEARYGSREN